MRQHVHSRSREAAPSPLAVGGARDLRQGVARRVHPFLRVVLFPFALLFAALAGVVFAILLPVCGIATIAEAIAKATWAFVRGAMPHTLSQSTGRN